MQNYIQDFINSNCSYLTRQEILSMNEKDNGPINNVINHLQEHCFGLWLNENSEIYLFYITNKIELSGLKISIPVKHSKRNELIFVFSKIVNDEYSDQTDLIETFNTYQYQVRTMFEKFQYFTYGNELAKNKGFIAVKNKVGIEFVPILNKTEAFKSIFDEYNFDENPDKENYIYLMFNPRSGLTKIGRNINPQNREKTLQGEDPNTQIIALWKADRKVEKILHQNFDQKRKRGEWFNLSITELLSIKEIMNKKTGNNNGYHK